MSACGQYKFPGNMKLKVYNKVLYCLQTFKGKRGDEIESISKGMILPANFLRKKRRWN
jgi:hypothetical protein